MIPCAMGVGTMAWSESAFWGYGDRLSLSDVEAAFRTSVAAGVTFFDTAEIYGHSERILGALVRAERQRVYVATKYAPFPTRFTRRAVLRALDRSLERLGLERVDLYQIHFPGGFVPIETLCDALCGAVAAGKVRDVGVSNFDAAQMRRAHAALAARGIALASNQVEFSLVCGADSVLQACRELGVTLIAYSPLGRGSLAGKNAPRDRRRFHRQFRGHGLASALRTVETLRAIGREHGRTPAQVALNWLARQPGVVPIPGAKTAAQALENAGALGWSMSDEEAARLP